MKLVYKGTKVKYDVELKAIKENVVEVDGDFPMREVGFKVFDDTGEYNYYDYCTLYRETPEGYQFSNNGEVWIEPTKTVSVNVVWNDTEAEEPARAESVNVDVYDEFKANRTYIDTAHLTEANEWTKSYDIKESHSLSIVCDQDVPGYNKEVSGTTVTYNFKQPYQPTIEEQLEEINALLLELDERVYLLEEGGRS